MKKTNIKELPQNIIDKIAPELRKELGVLSSDELDLAIEKNENKLEKAIQLEVEQWLVINGFERRSPESIQRGKPLRGWFIHMVKAKRNPIILDILIMHNDGRYLELELKTKHGAIRDSQKCLVDYGAPLFRDSKTAIEVIKIWMHKR